jgi:hypothetical protein
MLCETCRWTGRPGFVRGGPNAQDHEMIPRPECGGHSSEIDYRIFAVRQLYR